MVTDIVLYFSRQFLQNVVLSIQGFLAANEIYYENHYTESQLLEVNTIEYVCVTIKLITDPKLQNIQVYVYRRIIVFSAAYN